MTVMSCVSVNPAFSKDKLNTVIFMRVVKKLWII